MKFLLDTSVCIGLLRGRLPRSAALLSRTFAKDVVLCSVVRYELLLGAEKCSQPELDRARIEAFCKVFASLPFDDPCATECARIRAALEKAGSPCGAYDYQIAAVANVHRLIVVTRNVSEFRRVPGAIVQDWEVETPPA